LCHVEQPADRHAGKNASAPLIHESSVSKREKSPPARRA
jgi:hypothetical protein